MSVLPPNPEDAGPDKMTKKSLQDILNCLSGILSSLYALLLIAAFSALTSARIVNFPAKNHQVQVNNFLIYLLIVSIAFLLYIFCYLTRSSSSTRIWSHHKSHGSAFLRQGAIVFDILHSMVFFLFVIFIILQSVAIVMYPRLNINKFPVVAKFGMMHLVTTNVVIWIHTVVKESMHELVEAEEIELERHHHHHVEEAGNQSCIVEYLKKIVEDHHGECRDDEHFNNFLGDALIKASPYLFAFIIEFSLIGATVFYTTWCHVGPSPSPEDTPKMIEKPHPKDFISKIDWSHSLSGFLLGIFVAIVNFSNLAIFFLVVATSDVGNEFLSDVTNTLLNILGIIGCIYGLIKVQRLDHKQEEEESSLDLSMLNVSGFFMYFYAALTVVVGFNTTKIEGGNNVIIVVNGLVEMFYVTLQITFLTNLLQKANTAKNDCSDSCSTLDDGCKPGRQAVMFLILFNISQWFIATFELQKSVASPWEKSFFGFLPWVILQRISLPLCIFFRFHSAVIAIDCWKNVYKRESKEECIQEIMK